MRILLQVLRNERGLLALGCHVVGSHGPAQGPQIQKDQSDRGGL